MSDTRYPLNNKFERVSDLTHTIASFLEWAEKQKGLSLCEPYKPQFSWYTPIHTSKEQLLLEFFGIDLAAMESEKKQMIGEYITSHLHPEVSMPLARPVVAQMA